MQAGYLRVEGDSWLLTYRESWTDSHGRRGSIRRTVNLGPKSLSVRDAKRIRDEEFLPRMNRSTTPVGFQTLGSFIENAFVPEHVEKLQYGGQEYYRWMLRHVIPALGETRLNDLSVDQIQQLLEAKYRAGLSTETVRKIKSALSGVLSHAQRKGWDRLNFAKLTSTRPVRRVRTAMALTAEQARLVVAELQPPSRQMACLSIALSLGVTEILGLRWRNINLGSASTVTTGDVLEPGDILIECSVHKGREGETKNSSRRRILPAPPFIIALLRDWRESGANFVRPDEYVFATKTGRPYSEDTLRSRQLKPIGKKLDMPWLSWGVFRKTHATSFASLNLPMIDLMETMGHSSPRTSLRHYVLGNKERQRSSLEHLCEKVFNDKMPTRPT